jgi:group I intron endonuclease
MGSKYPITNADVQRFKEPIFIVNNVEIDKTIILTATKGKTGIYKWTHKKSGKFYIGSAVDLSKRLKNYYSLSELKRVDNYICRALLLHGYSSFSLTILEYIDILNSDIKNARKVILSREQHFIDSFSPDYNLNPITGSRLGSRYSKEIKAKMSKAKTGENNHFYSRTHSEETKALLREALSGKNYSIYGTFLLKLKQY